MKHGDESLMGPVLVQRERGGTTRGCERGCERCPGSLGGGEPSSRWSGLPSRSGQRSAGTRPGLCVFCLCSASL